MGLRHPCLQEQRMEVGTLYHGQAGDAVFVDTPNAPLP